MRVFVIAEAGVNHNGSLDMALSMVDEAAKAGADAVKFQTFKSEVLVSPSAAKADYQVATTGGEQSQLDMIRRLELGLAEHQRIVERCQQAGIEFMSTPFDPQSLELLLGLGVSRLKVSSGDLTNGPLLLAMARSGLPVILSTGMATLGEVEAALGALAFGYVHADGTGPAPSERAFRDVFVSGAGQAALRDKASLLHCTTEYPAPFSDVNLRVMDTLSQAFGLPTGLSDHTEGTAVAVAATARGAMIVEKHFTLDRNLPGPDHRASLTPGELADMVRSVRQVESALGSPLKAPAASEAGNAAVARRSLTASRPIRAGEPFNEFALAVKRPGTGLSPMRYWSLLGRPARRDYGPDELIDSDETI